MSGSTHWLPKVEGEGHAQRFFIRNNKYRHMGTLEKVCVYGVCYCTVLLCMCAFIVGCH